MKYKTNPQKKKNRRYRYYRFLSSVGLRSVVDCAHFQAFTFSSQDRGRLSIVRISKHSRFNSLKITVGCRLCCERVCKLGVVACVYVHVVLCVVLVVCCGVVVWCGFVWLRGMWHGLVR